MLSAKLPRLGWIPGVIFLTSLWPQSGRPTPSWAVISTISPLFSAAFDGAFDQMQLIRATLIFKTITNFISKAFDYVVHDKLGTKCWKLASEGKYLIFYIQCMKILRLEYFVMVWNQNHFTASWGYDKGNVYLLSYSPCISTTWKCI